MEAYYEYARYGSLERAEAKLEQMYADGDVCWAEHPRIERRGKQWRIMLPESNQN